MRTARWSPPSRAAWIEIRAGQCTDLKTKSRRLHGRRGLKYALQACNLVAVQVAAFTGGVD